MTDDKMKYTQEALEGLRKRVIDHRQMTRSTWKGLSGAMGIGESTLQAFALGKYLGDNQKVADEVAKWFRTGETQELFSHVAMKPGFQPTATAKIIFDNLIYAKLGNVITIIGEPGVGKTEGLQRFRRDNSNVWVVTASPSCSNYNAFLDEILGAMDVTSGSRSGYQLSQRVRLVLSSRSAPLICVDEAQHLGERVLEELRSMHDQTGCGLVFCGNREVTRTIDGTRTAQYAQRSSRVSKRVVLARPTGWDVKIMLEAWGVSDDKEIEFLERIAMRPGGGALRQMSKVLELATLMANGERKKRDLIYIKEAADELSAGLVA